jgi:hypothetical protein
LGQIFGSPLEFSAKMVEVIKGKEKIRNQRKETDRKKHNKETNKDK